MIHVEIIGARELRARFENAPAKLRQGLRDAIAWAQYKVTATIQSLLGGELLRSRTGNLRRSITPGAIEETATAISGIVGTNAIYARIQELGGTISAKNAAHLTIPLEAALTASGVARYSARDVISNPGVGGFVATFFRNGVLFGKDGQTITPLFALKASVTLPARSYMAAGLDRERGAIEQRFARALAAAVEA